MVPLQEFLGEALAGFKLCGGARGPESSPAAASELVDNAEHQRELRADDGQVGPDLIRHRDHRVQAFQIDGEALGLFGNARVAGCAINFSRSRRLSKFPYERVLAASAAENENFHGAGHSGLLRVGARGNHVNGRRAGQRLEVRLQRSKQLKIAEVRL